MFERRLKIFFCLLILFTLVLLGRAAQLQIVQADQWQKKAETSMRHLQMLETTRGEIRDFKGNILALDEPCWDAAVDYRAIERNEKWIQQVALSRLLNNPAAQYRAQPKDRRIKMLDEEEQRVHDDISEMWKLLAEVSGKTLGEINEIKSAIHTRVLMRQRYIWYNRYLNAAREHDDREAEREQEAWYLKLLSGEPAPQLDKFIVEVSEQTEAHVILGNIDAPTQARLKKLMDRYPGLVVRPGKHRRYPYGDVACHVIGHIAPVMLEDIQRDVNATDDLRKYYANDLIGRSGIESMAEHMLRGSRGKHERRGENQEIVETINPVPGKPVRVTIDINLQQQIEEAFRSVEFRDKAGTLLEKHVMYGAAVVIDVPTGEVRALVSYPKFDLNHFQELYPLLRDDHINRPFLNRATMAVFEPGSTVKPIIGIGAITDGICTEHDTIECTGYLNIDGRIIVDAGKCWTTKFASTLGMEGVKHHPFPVRHRDGHLVFSDALQRSCNIYFEMLGERMRIPGINKWFTAFGLGRPTGIGIPESRGLIPTIKRVPRSRQRVISWFSSIGQTQVLATPLQIANATATIARNGVWMRPRLISDAHFTPRPTTQPVAPVPDRVDLKVSPGAIAAAKHGMMRVVHSDAGTGTGMRNPYVMIAGKTGTAQAAPFKTPVLDESGKHARDEDGNLIWREHAMSTPAHPNPEMPWYRGSGKHHDELAHSWFVGFAPAENPQIAFAVMMEYGGSGGETAPIVRALLDACIEHGYVRPGPVTVIPE